MKEYREDLTRLLVAAGRKPDAAKLLHLITPVLGDTDEQAREILAAQKRAMAENLDGALAGLSYMAGIDMTQFDLDETLPDLTDRVNGHQSSFAAYQKIAATGKTLREVLLARSDQASVELVGTAETVAAQMAEVMDEVGG
jgi:alkanesulfonate monooxygenase SsuD/methylene tetrahydromethanopterin reductase-like flavin-dependent oxidoreductase (luciferase family)